MNQIQKQSISLANNLNFNIYFQALLIEAQEKKIVSDAELERIQLELVELLANQVERFNNGESSSIRVDKAQGILQSVCYNISAYLKSLPEDNSRIEMLRKENLKVLFRRGIEEIDALVKEEKALLDKIQQESLILDNIAYKDTIFNGLKDFFHDYEIEYSAQEDCGSIDYPLYMELTDLSGAEYMELYLKRLSVENDFCRLFSKEKVELLLRSYSKDWRDILVNIYELVLTNALGCELLEKEVRELNITEDDRNQLQKKLYGLDSNALKIKLVEAYENICKGLNVGETNAEYAEGCISQIAIRLRNNLNTGTLKQIFITLDEVSETEAIQNLYQDGLQMDDSRLRDFIEEIKVCRFTEDKIVLIRREVHSLNDLTEILSEGFYEQEYEEVFGLLNKTELEFLRQHIEEEVEFSHLSYEDGKEWEKQLLDYVKSRSTI